MWAKLKQSGYKLTKPRLAVLDYLKKQAEPRSAKEIHAKLKDGADLVSVHRALNLLEELGMIFRETIHREKHYYLAEHQHHHLICSQCHASTCLPCEHHFKNIKGYTQISHQLIITGLCSRCS